MIDLAIQRHSLEHVMVLAVRRLFGDSIRLGVGPVVENGLYQDFDHTFTQENFSAIESEMGKIIAEDLPFHYEIIPIGEAIKFFESSGQEYKVELLKDIRDYGTTRADREINAEEKEGADLSSKGLVSLYTVGSHRDLCRGPHVERTGQLKNMAFRLDRVAGAYWRGSERNKMLCRIYALAFASQEDLDTFLFLREEAKKRDHRKLGEELELFFFHETAPGLPYWLPKGVQLKNLLLAYWRQYHEARGYKEIVTPMLNKSDLWQVSGHWKHFKDDMMTCAVSEGEEWGLKPMNCPNAMIVWKHQLRSYRDLPLRLSDTSVLHRNEKAGSLSGLFRARCFCQDDSHNFVSEEQIGEEVGRVLEIVRDIYGVFGLRENVLLYLSTRPDEYMGDLATWDRAEDELRAVLKRSQLQYDIKEKDGAFYGPKIDIHLKDALGREWQCGTVQVDFQLPRNFGLEYADKDGARRLPVVIHRAIFGTFERFLAILIEHHVGRLPFWLAPVQVRVLPVNQNLSEYVRDVVGVLSAVALHEPMRNNELRYEVDDRAESLARRIRDAEVQKIPVSLIIGSKEAANRTVTLRRKAGETSCAIDSLSKVLTELIAT